MTQDDIISMAREAGAVEEMIAMGRSDGVLFSASELFRFAALVAAKAAAEEREACAQLAAQTVCDLHTPTGVKIYGSRAAKAIRARGTDAAKPAAQAQPVPAPGEPSEAPTQAQVDERSDTVWLFIRLGQKNIRRAITLLEIDSTRAPELAFGPLLLKAIAELRKT